MTQVEVDKWNAIADDTANNERIDRDLREMANRGLRIGKNLAVLEVEQLEVEFPIPAEPK
jgi:hypothetical protein